MIAALYVAQNGSYVGLDGVDAWPETRDARLYRGPHSVVAHPPCPRWGKLWAGQPLHIKQTGERKIKGDDGGCFEAALGAVRTYGGVLEHPCDSHAWAHFGLNKPPRHGGWIVADIYGGWTCCVEQGRYGHYARKPTWLYVCTDGDLPSLDWGKGTPRLDPAVIARMGFKRAQRLGEVGGRGGGKDSAPRIGTPAPFRDLLISIARGARTAPADPVRAALDNSQSLLAMIYQLNTNGSVSEHDWETEGLSDLITKQISENRAALSVSLPEHSREPDIWNVPAGAL